MNSKTHLITPLIIIPLSFMAQSAVINPGETITVPFIHGAQNPDDPSSPNEWVVDGFRGNLSDNGTLNVLTENGVSGSVLAFSTIVGTGMTNTGIVNVSGPGAHLDNSSFMVLGVNGSGYMQVTGGGRVTNASTGQMGVNVGSTGFAHINGSGSQWNSNAELLIGQAGKGTLQLSDGGQITAKNITLARDDGSIGTLIMGAQQGDTPEAPGILTASQLNAGAGTATIVLNHTSADFVFDDAINSGQDNAAGSGTGLTGNLFIDALAGRTIFAHDHGDFTGTLQAQEQGILQVNGDMSGADVRVLEGGRLEGTGRVGNTINSGTIAPGNSIGTLRVDGDYHGSGGTLLLESVLDGDDSPADRFIISGSATGDTHVQVMNLNGEGALTQNGIPLIYAAQLSEGDAFTLNGDFVTHEGEQAVISGAYAYALRTVKYGEGRWWYLTSDLADPQTPEVTPPTIPDPGTPEPGTVTPTFPVIPHVPDENTAQRYHPGAALYEQYPQVLAELNRMPSLQARVGNAGDNHRTGAWGRMEGNYSNNEPVTSTTGAQRKMNVWTLQTGVDGALLENNKGMLTGGINFRYGQASADISAYSGSGDIDTTGYGPGLTLTWYGNNGFYIDSQAQIMFFDSSLNSDTLGESLTTGNKGKGYAGSLETGWRLDAGNGYSLTPQAQIVWSRVSFDRFEDQFGTRISLSDGDSVLGRVGLSGDKRSEWQDQEGTTTRSTLHVSVDVLQEMAQGTAVNVDDVRFSSRDARTQLALSTGGTLDWADGRYAVYGNVGVQASPHNPQENYGAGGNLGVRVSW